MRVISGPSTIRSSHAFSIRHSARRLRQPCRCLIHGRIVPMDAVVNTLHHNGGDYFVVAFREMGP
jgi:hypothetical protein